MCVCVCVLVRADVIMVTHQLACQRPLCFTVVVYFVFFVFCHLISEVAWPIVTKLCHMFGGDPDLQVYVTNLGGYSQKNLVAEKPQNSVQLYDFIMNISGLQQDVISRKMALKTVIRSHPHMCT